MLVGLVAASNPDSSAPPAITFVYLSPSSLLGVGHLELVHYALEDRDDLGVVVGAEGVAVGGLAVAPDAIA